MKTNYYKGMHYYNEYKTENGNSIFQLSKWQNIREIYNITNKNKDLGYYLTDENGYREGQENFNPENGTFCRFFQFMGHKYAIDRFILCNSCWGCNPISFTDNKGELHYIAAYDSENYYNPLLIEIDESGEKVRIFMED